MDQLKVNCTEIEEKILNCSSPSKERQLNFVILAVGMLLLSATGFILNSIASYILTFSLKTDSKFLKFVKIYTFNCMLINLNDTVITILTLTATGTTYNRGLDKFFTSEAYIIYFNYFGRNLWSLTYTFSSILDLQIVYERILLYLPSLRFLRLRSVSSISFGMLAYTILLNIPLILTRDYEQHEFNFNGNTTVYVYFGKFKEYTYQEVFLSVFYVTIFLRDIVQLALDILFNTTLIIVVIRYYRKRTLLSKELQVSNVANKINLNKTKIAFIICLLSTILQLTTALPILLSSLNLSRFFYVRLTQVVGLLGSLKHASNFFFLLKLNEKFADIFWMKRGI